MYLKEKQFKYILDQASISSWMCPLTSTDWETEGAILRANRFLQCRRSVQATSRELRKQRYWLINVLLFLIIQSAGIGWEVTTMYSSAVSSVTHPLAVSSVRFLKSIASFSNFLTDSTVHLHVFQLCGTLSFNSFNNSSVCFFRNLGKSGLRVSRLGLGKGHQ